MSHALPMTGRNREYSTAFSTCSPWWKAMASELTRSRTSA